MGNCCSDELAHSTCSNTPSETYDFVRAKIIKVYDGDTFWISANHNGKLLKFKMRLYGCDCPEMKTEEGKSVKEYVKNLIDNKIVRVSILNNKIYSGKKVVEKYGRLLGFVWVGDINLTNHLIEKGFAKPYFGGTKE